VLRALDQLKSWIARLWVPVAIALVFYANSSDTVVTGRAFFQNDINIQVDPPPTVVISAPSMSFIYLPHISGGLSAKVYWGALVDGQAPSTENMQSGGIFDLFETNAQKKMSILHWGQPWIMNGSYQSFYTPWFDDVRSHGSIPMLDWSSWNLNGGINQPEFKLSQIYTGVYDDYIRQWALGAKSWGHPFFLRFDWEMNGNWQYPWSEQLNGNQPGDYIKAWQHVHDIFAQINVTNVTWVWCPNISSPVTRSMASLYPGDAYVDWTCLDGYNKYNTWLGFDTVFTGRSINWLYNSYQEILTVAPTKPLMLGEVASLEAGDGGLKKANWITDAFTNQLPVNFPKIKAIVWYNWDNNNPTYTFPVESSQASLEAFSTAIKSNYFAKNDFANLNTSPIPPLP
jgi:hypothetical protein